MYFFGKVLGIRILAKIQHRHTHTLLYFSLISTCMAMKHVFFIFFRILWVAFPPHLVLLTMLPPYHHHHFFTHSFQFRHSNSLPSVHFCEPFLREEDGLCVCMCVRVCKRKMFSNFCLWIILWMKNSFDFFYFYFLLSCLLFHILFCWLLFMIEGTVVVANNIKHPMCFLFFQTVTL